jgi:beta-barrel assembly-enhancing protease
MSASALRLTTDWNGLQRGEADWATAVLFAVAAQAVPSETEIAAYRALVQQDLRLATIGYRLQSANAPFCSRRERNPGWVLHDEQQYPDRTVAQAAFGMKSPIAIAATVPGGPAHGVGLVAGDGLIAVNDTAIAADVDVRQKPSAERIERFQRSIRNTFATLGPIRLTLETGAGRRQVVLDPPSICASRFWVDARPKLDAGADGEGVRVTEGLMAFTAQDDAELAAVAAHELAHNLLGHRQRIKAARNRTSEILATEIEADRLSVWLMANAGYDPVAALRFIERYGRKTGLGIFSDGTHLRWKSRVKVMQSEIDMMQKTQNQNGLLPPPLLVGDE